MMKKSIIFFLLWLLPLFVFATSYTVREDGVADNRSYELFTTAELNVSVSGLVSDTNLTSVFTLNSTAVNVSSLNVDDYVGSNDGTLTSYTFYHGVITGVIINSSNGYDFGDGNTNGVYFDGTDDYVRFDKPGGFNPVKGSMSAWLKTEGLLGGRLYFSSYTSNSERFRFANNLIRITSGGVDVDVVLTLGDSNWHHVVVNWDNETMASGKTVEVYLDGILHGSSSSSFRAPNLPSVIDLGAQNGASNFWNGSLDEIRVWSTTLTQAEVQAEMNVSSPVKDDNLLISYSFEQFNSSHALDTNPIVQGVISEGVRFDGNEFVNVSGITSMPVSQAWLQKNASGNWHHFVNSSGTIYANGVIGSLNGTVLKIVDGALIIGQDFNGSLDQIIFFNKSLTAHEAKEIYENASFHSGSLSYCVDINGMNWSCFSGVDGETVFNLSVVAEFYEFNDSLTVKNLSTSGLVGFSSDNRTDLNASVLNVTGFVLDSICYQETANVSTSCGGLSSGAYSSSDFWNDGVWNDSSTIVNSTGVYVNYTKPVGATNDSLLQAKYYVWQDSFTTSNGSIPTTCWDYSNTLQIQIHQIEGSVDTRCGPVGQYCLYIDCYNGVSWKNSIINSGSSASSASFHRIYEEAMWWNITGYPTNVTVDSGNDGVVEVVLPGKLKRSNLTQDVFFYSNTYYSAYNFSFSAAGTKTFSFNVSTSQNDFLNISFNITGYDVNAESLIFYESYFNVSAPFINSTLTNLTVQHGVFESFENNLTASSKWSTVESGTNGWSAWEFRNTSSCAIPVYGACLYSQRSLGNINNPPPLGTILNSRIKTDMIMNLNNVSFLRFYRSDNVERLSGSGSSAQSYAKFYLSDGSNRVLFFEDNADDSDVGVNSCGGAGNITLSRNNLTANVWDVNYTGSKCPLYTPPVTVDTGILDSSKNLRFQIDEFCECARTGGGGCECNHELRVGQVWIGGSWMGLDAENDSVYNSSGSVVSAVIFNSSSDIVSATACFSVFKESNDNFTFYLSNNGTSWQVIDNCLEEVFVSSGSDLFWKVDVNNSDTNTSPAVLSVYVTVVSGSVQNPRFDLGNDGGVDWSLSGFLNTSTSPKFVTFDVSDAEGYVLENCAGLKSCDVITKIIVDTAGVLEVSSFESVQDPNPVGLNVSVFESCQNCEVNISFSNGKVQVDSLNVSFYGSRNTSVFSYRTDDRSDNLTSKIFVKFSKFNISSPVDYFEYVPNWENDTFVEPFGQEANNGIPIFNFTSLAYDESVDLYFRYNESQDSCITQFCGNTSNSTVASWLLSNSTINISENLAEDVMRPLFCWSNYSGCSYTSVDDPYSFFFSLCNSCVRTSNWIEPS